jgi:hypothetical protein
MTDDSLEELLTGGNHLASVLVGRLGAGKDGFPSYSQSIEAASLRLSDENLDLWICWRAIMRFRDRARKQSPELFTEIARLFEEEGAAALKSDEGKSICPKP